MHEDEVTVDAALVSRLIAAQCAQWAGLPLTRIRHAGTDNAMFRLEDGFVVRLPRIGWGVQEVASAPVSPWVMCPPKVAAIPVHP